MEENQNTKYHTNENVGIRKVAITGVKKPLFTIWGTTTFDKCEYIFKVDGKEIDKQKIKITEENDKDFYIEAILSANSNRVQFIIKEGDTEHLMLEKKTSTLRRAWFKVKNEFKIKIGNKVIKALRILGRGIRFLWREHRFLVPPAMWKKYIKHFIERMNANEAFYNPMIQADYLKWISENEIKDEKIEKFEYNPLISIAIPVYNVEGFLLSECIDSILEQSYENFEICLADDCSTNQATIDTLKEYENKDKRVKVVYRKENGHISKATNSALEIANGEFIGLVDNDDKLTKNALYEVVKVLNKNRELDFIYSDEDKLDLKGKRCEPHFKPDFSPDTLMSFNYICHFSVIRKSVITKVGGFEVGLEGAQDYDLFLKVVEQTQNIYHIPKVLYHWRMIPGSTSMTIDSKSYAIDKGKMALENALKRRGINAEVNVDEITTYYIIDYKYEVEPRVSIIIPTRDYASTLRTCIESLYKLTTYKNYEVLIMNNQSQEKETFDLFDEYKEKYDNFKVIDVNTKFNYSNINNIGVKESTGEYILLLNNDTEILHEEWLGKMVGYAMQPHIGTVGAKLYYPDMTVQHCGVIMGIGGVAAHAGIGQTKESPGLYARLRVAYNYSANTAACLMISKAKFMESGMLEEELEVAFNDVDFNLKVLEKGYYNICLPQVQLIHFESKSRGLDTTTEKYKRFVKEVEYMQNKWNIEKNKDRFYNENYSLKGEFVMDKR